MSNRLRQELPELLALAHDRSDGARLTLASRLADLFLKEDLQLTAREELLLNELIEQLLKTNNSELRRDIAKRFADVSRLPRTMAVGLAKESIDVAQAILTASEILTDDDLISIVESTDMDHACAIASRRSINEAVADALVTTGDLQVMQIVAENLGAKLSPRAVRVLAEASRMTQSLQRPILYRPELPQDTAVSLYWWLSEDLRRYALQRFGISAGQIDKSLDDTIDAKLGEHILERSDDEAMSRVAEWLDDRGVLTPRILPQVLRLGHYRLFNIILSRASKLTLDLIDIIVGEAGGRMLAVLARSMNIDKSNFVSIFLLARGARTDEQIVHPRELSHAIAAFDRLMPGMAQTLLRTWRDDPSYVRQRNEVMIESMPVSGF